ncbi:hypothetical protein [Sorangium sp. So ce1151]|uniref:hypothetical protein n=1 Tax=Sorangium sp. So ce1151 TaxID=3133332 RepID=UPI003F5EC4AE
MNDWNFEQNLRPWLEIVGRIIGYEFDDDDWNSVRPGVAATDSEEGCWYEPPLGDRPMTIRLALEVGTEVVTSSLDGLTEQQQELVRLAVSIATGYRLVARR